MTIDLIPAWSVLITGQLQPLRGNVQKNQGEGTWTRRWTIRQIRHPVPEKDQLWYLISRQSHLDHTHRIHVCCYIWCSMDPINIPLYVSIYTSTMDPMGYRLQLRMGKKNRPCQISSGKSRAVRFHLFHPKEYPELRTIRERLGPNVSNTRPWTRRWSSEKTQPPKELRRLHKRNPSIMSDLLRNWYHLVLVAVLKNAGLREKLWAGCSLSRFHFQPHDHSMAIPGTDLLEVPTKYIRPIFQA